MTSTLEVREIVTNYGQSQVLHGVSLVVGKGGRLPSGKEWSGENHYSQVHHGVDAPCSGNILLKGIEIVDRKPFEIVLEEPVEGLAPLVVRNLVEVLHETQRSGATILLAEQNLKFYHKFAERGYILKKGVIHYQGDMENIWQDEEIVRKYLAL